MARMTSVLRAAGTVVIVAIYAVFAGGSEQSKANCDVESVETSADAGMINGELDAGYKVSFTLLNKGEAGVIKVHVLLSTSEGDFTRDRSVHLEGGRSVPLEFFVHEPTINAGNIQSRVSCVP